MRRVLDRIGWVPEPQRFIAVMWLSFLTAGVATTVFFALIDPEEIAPCLPDFPDLTRMQAYTVGFFLFWLLTASSSLLTTYFLYPSRDDGRQGANDSADD